MVVNTHSHGLFFHFNKKIGVPQREVLGITKPFSNNYCKARVIANVIVNNLILIVTRHLAWLSNLPPYWLCMLLLYLIDGMLINLVWIMLFLYEHHQEIVYMHQKLGFKRLPSFDHVCLHQRSLCGPKKASHTWFHMFA